MEPKEVLKSLFLAGLETCLPVQAVKDAVSLKGKQLIIKGYELDLGDRPVYVLAAGKAAVPMYEAMQDILGEYLCQGLVITSQNEKAKSCNADELITAAHPKPDEQSFTAGKKAVAFFKEIPENGLVLNLLSGGTSSLMCHPAEGISVGELNTIFELLNNSGATISEINTVRKHCSQIKGGQLLRFLNAEATLVDLVISDVPDDDLSVIGSGPTTPDLSTYQDAYHILLNYELWDQLPGSVRSHIERGLDGQRMETLKPGEDPLREHYAHIISSAQMLAEKISELASDKGFSYQLADKVFNEDVVKISKRIAEKVVGYTDANHATPTIFIYYGESTVQVTGDGKGGRNQELALRGAVEIADNDNISWLSAGTDGVDGPTDAAGAIVDGTTIPKAKEKGLDAQSYLRNNDSYHFHEQMGTILKTGPTGNNLMDLVLVLVE